MKNLSPALVVVLASLLVLLAACAPAAAPTATKAPAPQPTLAAVATPTAVRTPTPAPRVLKGKLVHARADLGNEDSDAGFYITSQNQPWMDHLYASLIDIDGDGKLVPGLATAWEAAPDGTSWVVTLRGDAKFHNGKPVTAEDVKFSWERYIHPDSQTHSGAQLRKVFDRIEITDANKLVYRFKEPLADFQVHVARYPGGGPGRIYPKAYFEEVARDGFKKKPVAAGPFKWVSHAIGDSIELEAFTDYYGGAPQFKTLLVKKVPESSTRMAMLRTGEADIIPVSGIEVQEAKNQPNVKLFRSPAAFGVSARIQITTGPKALQDVRVRKAINLAVDRQAIIDKLYFGEGTVSNSYYSPNALGFGYDPAVKPYPFDRAQAKELLKEAGYPDGFPLNLYTAPDTKEIAEAVQSYLIAAGIAAKLNVIEYQIYIAKWTAKERTMDGMGFLLGSNRADWGTNVNTFLATTGPWNHFFFSDSPVQKQVDELLRKQGSTLNPTARDQVLRDIDKIWFGGAHALFLVHPHAIFATSAKIKEWQLMSGYSHPLRLEKAVVAAE